jgi:hypothetical protein
MEGVTVMQKYKRPDTIHFGIIWKCDRGHYFMEEVDSIVNAQAVCDECGQI